MSDLTRINLIDDVEDMAPRFGMAPNAEARTARGSSPSALRTPRTGTSS